jgi:hypothetical protein
VSQIQYFRIVKAPEPEDLTEKELHSLLYRHLPRSEWSVTEVDSPDTALQLELEELVVAFDVQNREDEAYKLQAVLNRHKGG